MTGAVRFSIDDVSDKSSTLPHMLPSVEQFTESCQQLGLNREERIIVYCTPGALSAARVWWTFKIFGIENVSVLVMKLLK